MLCYVMLCYVMLCYVMLCYVMLCYVMLCYVMLCYVMLCYVMLCYALNTNLIISAIHILGKLSVPADHKSRIFKDSIEWMLSPSIFKGVVARLGRPDTDLFASRVNHQIPEFVSWRPEQNAVATDAFNLTWNYHLSYLFPPFSLIPLCLKKILRDQAECILNCTSLEKQTMVSNSSVNVVTPAFAITSVPISSSTLRKEQDSHLLY